MIASNLAGFVTATLAILVGTMNVAVVHGSSAGHTLANDHQLYADSGDGPNMLTNGVYEFGLDDKGRIYLEGPCGTQYVVNEHGNVVKGGSEAVLKIQTDGNFVLYDLTDFNDGKGHPEAVWDTKTTGGSHTKVKLTDEGKVEIVSAHPAHYTVIEADKSCLGDVCKGDKLTKEETLERGEFLCKDDMKFGLNNDGEWVYIDDDKTTVFGSVSDSFDADIKMQGDGNLVLYQFRGHHITAVCSTNTAGNHHASLRLGSSGPAIKKPDGTVVWNLDSHPAIACLGGHY